MVTRFPLRLIPAAILGLSAGTACASGFQLLEQNASGLGNAYAGSAAVAENASTIFFNPAGLTLLEGRNVSAGITAVRTSYEFNNSASSVGALGTAGNGGNGGGVGIVPNAYVSMALTKNLYLGLGIGAPFGLKTDYDNPWIGGAQSLKFDIRTVNVNPSVAYRVSNKLSVGFGLDWQRMKVDYERLIGTTSALTMSTSTINFKADDDAWGWNAGLLWQVSPTTKVGVSYRSSLKFDLSGNLSVGSTSPTLLAAASSAKATIKVPDTFIVSTSQTLDDRWEMLGDISWTGWRKIDQLKVIYSDGTPAQTLDAKFRNTWRVALGANYILSDAWKLKFGIARDQTPIRDAEHRLVSLPDNNRYWLSIGSQWKPSKAMALDLGLAYLYIKDAEINNDQTANLRGLVNGTFSDSAWIFGAQYSMSF